MISMHKSDGAFLNEHSGIQILNCTDTPLQHWTIKSNGLAVVMNVNQCDIEPEILIRNDYIFLGAEQGVFVLDIKTGVVVSDVSNVSSVQWIDEDASSHVVFAAEDELIVFDNLGQLAWRKNLSDVIETTDIMDGYLVVTDMSKDQHNLSLLDGSQI